MLTLSTSSDFLSQWHESAVTCVKTLPGCWESGGGVYCMWLCRRKECRETWWTGSTT